MRLSTTLSMAKPAPPASSETVGDFADGKHGEHGLVAIGGDVELEQHLGPGVEGAVEQRHQLAHRVALVRVGVRLRVGDHLGVADEHGVDDPQTGGPQRPARLGDLDHAVGDVGDLGLARPVAQPDIGGRCRDRRSSGRVSSGYSVDTRTPAGSSLTDVTGESSATATTSLIGSDVAFE